MQQRQHVGADALQRFGRLAFKAQHQHRCGVAGADQPKAIGPVHPQAINGADVRGRSKHPGRHFLQFLTQAVRFALCAGHVQFRG